VLNFSIPKLGLRLPAGLSFYVFMTITYLVDIYRGKMEAEVHPGNYALYVAYFPKILAGPIERARNFLPQLRQKIIFNSEKATQGLQLLLFGLFKKVVIADRIAPFVTNAYNKANFSSPFELTLATYLFAFQIYCDFSGYTDIARGAAKLMGIDLMENFKRPFLSKSPSEFWSERWHISLGTWFRDYMYIPMGGNRVSWPRYYFNLMTVFAVSGIWHAGLGYGVSWAFLIWGVINGIYAWVSVATAPFWKKMGVLLPKVRDSLVLHILRVLFTFHLILFTLVFFRANSAQDAFTIITRIYKGLRSFPMLFRIYKYSPELYLTFGLIALLMIIEIFDERRSIWEGLRTRAIVLRWGFYYALIFGLVLLGKWGLTQFIYMQF
jgi:D-alanyl-lipoteichoic acid acyltransferase DltB (MBOAT superfamily)